MSNIDPDILKIPAFKRRRSIQSRSSKRLLLTAFDRKEAGVSVVKKSKPVRRCRAGRRKKEPVSDFTPPMIFDEPVSNAELEKISARARPVQDSVTGFRKMQVCGICEGYLDNIEVAIIVLSRPLRTGDRVLFETGDGLFEQTVESMQINRKDVKMAKKGSDIGMKVLMKPKENGKVYKVV